MANIAINSGCVIAMQGKQCIGIATDRRFGLDSHTYGEDFQKIFKLGPHIFVGLTGLQTDILTVYNRLKYRKVAYEVKMGRIITPQILSEMLSHMLYEHRFGPFVIESLVAGLDSDTFEPYICWLDQIGCCVGSKDYIVSGTCSDQMIGMCQNVWVPDQNGDQLFDALSSVVLNSLNRDAFSGLGSSIVIVEKDKVMQRVVNTRKD